MRLHVYGLVLAAALLCWTKLVRADNQGAAEALFHSAKALTLEGKWADACPKFEASFELDEQLGTLMNLADCLEHEGKLATAWADWTRAVVWARRVRDPRLAWVEGREKQVASRLPKLQITVPHAAAGLRVEQNGTAVPPASYGVAVAVDPGPVVVQVLRGDELLDKREVQVEESHTTTVELDLAAIAAAHPATARAPELPPVPSPVALAASKDAVEVAPYDSTQRTVGLVVGGVGVVAVLVAGGLEIGALVKKGQADAADACVNKICSPQGLDAAHSGAAFAVAGQWLGIAGLATAAVGATILFTAPSEPAASAWLQLAPWASPRGGGVLVGGAL